jgi:hypothetical protein
LLPFVTVCYRLLPFVTVCYRLLPLTIGCTNKTTICLTEQIQVNCTIVAKPTPPTQTCMLKIITKLVI